MTRLSIKLAQNPVLIGRQAGPARPVPLVGCIAVHLPRRTKVGGLKVCLETLLAQGHQKKWTKQQVIQSFEADIVHWTQWLDAGMSEYEFVIEVPSDIWSTRTTRFDCVRHTLSAYLFDDSPCYDELERGSLWNTWIRMRRKIAPRDDVLAVANENVLIFRTICSPEEEGQYNHVHFGDIPALHSQFRYTIRGKLLTLGSSFDVSLLINDLSLDTTIHAIDIHLVQRTFNPATEIDAYDEFRLHTAGSWVMQFRGRPPPEEGTYLWRGNRATPTKFDYSASLSLPSPILGAAPSCDSPCAPLAPVEHILRLTVHFSILNEDRDGKPLSMLGSKSSAEGDMRTWSIERELVIASDIEQSGQAAPPLYTDALDRLIPSFEDVVELPPSIDISRSTSISHMGRQWLRPVPVDALKLRRCMREHWEETGGLCMCFRERRTGEGDGEAVTGKNLA